MAGPHERSVPRRRSSVPGPLERGLAVALAVLALLAALLGSGWWWPLALAALALVLVPLLQRRLLHRLEGRRARRRGAPPP